MPYSNIEKKCAVCQRIYLGKPKQLFCSKSCTAYFRHSNETLTDEQKANLIVNQPKKVITKRAKLFALIVKRATNEDRAKHLKFIMDRWIQINEIHNQEMENAV